MLGRTAGGLFWMFRYLERAENTARLLDVGFRIALPRPDNAADEWASVLQTAGIRAAYDQKYDSYEQGRVVDFMLRDKDNHSSALAVTTAARTNARMVRTLDGREKCHSRPHCRPGFAGCFAPYPAAKCCGARRFAWLHVAQ